MTPLEALLEVLERVGPNRGEAALVSEEELSRWPVDAIVALKRQKLLERASPAASVVCPGCEQECTMPVHTRPSETGAAASFVVCDKRDDISRVAVSAERLRQWRCSAEAVGGFVAQSMGLRSGNQRRVNAWLWELGLVTGKKRSQMVCVRMDGALELVAGSNAVPLAQVVSYKAGSYAVDSEAIRQLVDTATTGDCRYTPSNARREARKLGTQAMHESWRKAYRRLKKSRPSMSDVWYSQQIAKMDISNRRSADTIRKHMKR